MTDPRPEVEPRRFLILRRLSSGAEAAFELDDGWRNLPDTVANLVRLIPAEQVADSEWCVVTAAGSREAGWPTDPPHGRPKPTNVGVPHSPRRGPPP